MYKKKLLSAAIGTALAMGAGASYAGELKLVSPTIPPSYASEEIGTSGDQDIDQVFKVSYTIAPTTIDTNLYAVFTLDGATWRNSLTSAALTVVGPEWSIVKDGAEGEKSVQFLIDADGGTGISNTNTIDFEFQLGEVYVLAEPNNEVTLKIELTAAQGGNTADSTETVEIANSVAAVAMDVMADTINSRTEIDVAQGGTVFINSIDSTTTRLGAIRLDQSSTGAKSKSGSSSYTFNAEEGTFTILNGIFAASQTNDSVFIDVGGTQNVFDSGTDLVPIELDATSATWEFTQEELTALYNDGTAKSIIVIADGTTLIKDNPDAPTGTLKIKFQTDRVASGTLKHVQRNGTVCTLYNIPGSNAPSGLYYPDRTDDATLDVDNDTIYTAVTPGAQARLEMHTPSDWVAVRVTNRSATKAGVVLGTLYDKSGTVLFTNQTLVAELASHATVKLTAKDLEEALSTATEGAVTSWSGRAVLVVSSDLTSMEVFGLLRNAAGGSLMNASTGAKGNSCNNSY